MLFKCYWTASVRIPSLINMKAKINVVEYKVGSLAPLYLLPTDVLFKMASCKGPGSLATRNRIPSRLRAP